MVRSVGSLPPRPKLASAHYLMLLLALALGYFALAKAGLALASVNPSATPIWPPTGFALAAVLLWGYRVWPAILAAALLANALNAGSLATSAAIAAGNTLECLAGGYLLNRYCGGPDTFSTPTRIAVFGSICLFPTALSATIGVGSLTLGGFAPSDSFSSIWSTWWLGDYAGALVVTPVIVLWARSTVKGLAGNELLASALVFAVACAVGLIAFSPLIEQTSTRGPLAFLAILPLLWAALYRGPRDTATVALLLSAFAIWSTVVDGGPFAGGSLNDSFLMLLVFMISVVLPSLALSADVAIRRETELNLVRAQEDLDRRVGERTAELAIANHTLEAEIEQRKAVEGELRLQGAHLLEAQRLANLGSWAWNVATGKVTWSARLFQIYGLKPEEFGGTFEDFLARLHDDDRERVRQEIETAFRERRPFRLQERIVRPGGEIRYLLSSGEVIRDENGTPVQMLGVCQDVTERQKAESALRTAEAQYRLLVESVRDYAIFMLDRDGHVVSWNTGAARIKGYSGFEIIGKSFREFYTEEDRVRGVPERAIATAEREGRYEAEGWRVRKDGSRFWANALIEAIRDDRGNLLGFAKVTRDITDWLNAQKELEQTREKLAQAQKMEAIGQLTGGIAHDFNNLLMIASGHAQLLRRRLSDPKHLQAVEAIHLAATRGESLTRQLLAFSRRQPLNPVVVNVAERVESVREMIGSSLRGDIHFIRHIPSDLWLTEVDPGEFEVALVNIAVNARDAMPEGGNVTLSAQNVTLPPNRIPTLQGDFVELRLSDSGSGIAPELIPKIFEPFFTTKAVGKGTGLGLSQVYGFAKQSGGAVTVESEVGRGTTICLYLPRCKHALPIRPANDDPPEPERTEGTILAVEDNLDVAKVTASLLEELGYTVLRASNAADALARIEKGEKIDLVFSDIVMPGAMNGVGLAREIAGRYPQLPIVLTSGYSDAVQQAAAQFPILRKPFEVVALDRIVRQALRKSRH